MLDIGMSEMVIIGVVSLIVVGPKDLPQMFRKVGTFVGKARGMAREFQSAMHEAAEDSGVNDLKSSYDKATNFKDLGLDDLKLGAEYSADLKPAADIPAVAPPKDIKKQVKSPIKKPAAKKNISKTAKTAKSKSVLKKITKEKVVKKAK
ncbi:Sec-independent protein translocase protein TatB [Amylibacter sp.]|nr:Sec-independent protein translocase protein TatB [Amylibacter sp.]MDB9816774.1 Sec-independent protein translocase protein TatB [Amylibacter sp.]